MVQGSEPEKNNKQYWLNLTLAGVAGQVGCITLIIILAAVLGGLWLDSRFQTKPMFTVGLLLVSIPISLFAMLYIVRKLTSKIKAGSPKNESARERVDKEVDIGKSS
jgi:hypothetical protein